MGGFIVLNRHFLRATFVLCLLLCLGWFSRPAYGQRAAEISGSLVDSTGAALPGVQVDATHTATGVKRSTVTNEAGLYRFVELVVGSYRIEASKAGFKTHLTTVVVESSRTTTVNIT
ncbi:MAG: carboxypeptidase regulatory-like domain-containing protein, partial [Acidobacteria bacterium]|nr:carboxypeptidase regulatory-like domain-containing protein [Acidobacteriota bacterium]